MTESFDIAPRAGKTFLAGLSAAAFRNRPVEQTIQVDVSASLTKADISRRGFSIPEIPLLADRIGSFLDDRPIVATKVVSQTIAPGTSVAVGTTIDIVLTSPGDVPMAVVPGIHKNFATLTMANLHDQFSADIRVRDILRTRASASELTGDDITSLTAVLQAQQIPIGNAPDDSVASAFTALQAAFTFQS